MTGTLFELFLAGLAFVGSHVVVSSTALRPALVGVLGERPFLVLYSLLSIALLVWMVRAYGAAPYIEYWATATGHRHLAMSLMFVACMFVVAGLSSSSPTGVLAAAPPPVPSGIVKVTRHPVMWGVGLWGFAHMVYISQRGRRVAPFLRLACRPGAAWHGVDRAQEKGGAGGRVGGFRGGIVQPALHCRARRARPRLPG